MGILNKLSPLECVSILLKFLITSKKMYLNWWYVLLPFATLFIYGLFIYVQYPNYFFSEYVLADDNTPRIVTYFYVSIICFVLLMLIVTFGQLAKYLDNKLEKTRNHKEKIMNDLYLNYQEFNALLKKEREEV